MKNLKKVLALVLAVVMIMGTVAVASAKDYADVKADNNYAQAIDVLSNLNILDGFKTGETYNFQPDGYFTRAQAAKIVAIVHNAATNGKIKNQEAISSLYANAQNPFVDCNGSWALPFINYCRITGLADGMTATTYAPERRLTGVQWLKLMLTTLNFDTAKEGYTGTGWDINVLNRANELDLLAGLPEGWKAIENIKRGEAAQILYNALTTSLVEYGQNIKGYNPPVAAGRFLDKAFVANETVEATGVLLATKMGVGLKRNTDAFRRPGYTWSDTNSGWSKFYMDAPKAEYKTAVTMCDVLKVMGVPDTNGSKVIKLDGISSRTKTQEGYKAEAALNYYAVDGYKMPVLNNPIYGTVLQHKQDKSCQSTSLDTWFQPVYGDQGDLTQVFKTEDGWVITTIHTFLSEITSVRTLNRKDHATAAMATVKAWIDCNEEPVYDDIVKSATFGIDSTDYAVGSKLLLTMTFKKNEVENVLTEQNYTSDKVAVVSYEVPETKVGKLTGASDLHYPTTVSIDGTQYNANCRFIWGRDDAMKFANYNTRFTFYFDTYGNVIGCGPVTGDATNYAVLDRIYGEHVKGKFVLKGDIYANGSLVEDATISNTAGSFKNFTGDWDNDSYNPTFPGDEDFYIIYTDADRNEPQFTDALYTYSVDDKGVYTLTWVGLFDEWDGLGRISTDPKEDMGYNLIQHLAKRASISVFTDNGMEVCNISESTKFICKGVDGTWKTYTGYTELPALTAKYMDYVLEADGSSFASVVYLGEVIYAADKIVGYVPTWAAFNWANGYDVITVYVKGEAVKVNLKHGDQYDGEHFGDVLRDPGMYEFEMAVDENGVSYAQIKRPLKLVKAYEGLVAQCIDKTAIIVNDSGVLTPAIGLTGVKLYHVVGDTITEMAAADLVVGDYVVVYSEDDEITEIYVYDTAPATRVGP